MTEREQELTNALREYGQHKPGCAANYAAKPSLDNCDCGLGAALALTDDVQAKD